MTRLTVLLVVVAVTGLLGWLVFRSPFLAVKKIVVEGAARSATRQIIEDHAIRPGVAIVSVKTGELATAIGADPWVRSVVVEKDWPDRVLVTVEERIAVARVRCAGTVVVAAVDGTVLPVADPAAEPLGEMNLADVACDQLYANLSSRMALEFMANLPPRIARVTIIDRGSDGMVAQVSGYPVRLGTADGGEAKARALVAVLEDPPPVGSTITLIAPSRPAVMPPSSTDSTTGITQSQP